jgi:hypothetical protein
MPAGTKVDRCYQKVKQTHSKGSAAAICQASTGQALATGKPPKHPKPAKGKKP